MSVHRVLLCTPKSNGSGLACESHRSGRVTRLWRNKPQQFLWGHYIPAAGVSGAHSSNKSETYCQEILQVSNQCQVDSMVRRTSMCRVVSERVLTGVGSMLRFWAMFCGTPGGSIDVPQIFPEMCHQAILFQRTAVEKPRKRGQAKLREGWQMRSDAMQALLDAPAPGPLFHAQWRDEGTSSSGH